MKIVEKRYAKEKGAVLIEEAQYLKAGTGLLEETDSRVHPIPGQEGKWLAVMITNFLGVLEDYDPKIYHGKLPLRSEVSVITSDEYLAIKNQQQDFMKEQLEQRSQSGVSRRNRLIGKFNSGKLFANDPETFEDTYGFTPTNV